MRSGRRWLVALGALAALRETSAQKRPIPEYVQGDECLFCHRHDIGPTWPKNAHGAGVRPTTEKGATHVLGVKRLRYLKQEGYGNMALLSGGAWDSHKFAHRCAGCHMTAFDSSTRTFANFGLDCYSCHGVVPLDHSSDISKAWLSKPRRGDAVAVVSTCAQCHLRGARSKATGLPFAYNYTAPEKLFDDFAVDWTKADDKSLNPGDRHVYRNARDVILRGEKKVTCLTCHQVHPQTTTRHWTAYMGRKTGAICFDCHRTSGRYTPGYTVTSAICEY